MASPAPPRPLHAATLDLHHAVEATAVGAAMASGRPPPLWYAGWLAMKGALHARLDPALAPASRRAAAYAADLAALGIAAPAPAAAAAHVAWIDATEDPAERERRVTGAAYVMVGGALMGGEVIRRRLDPALPSKSFRSPDRATEMAMLQQYRQRADCVAEARACFQALIDACAEIEGWA